MISDESKPFVVVKSVRGADVASYYQHRHETTPYDAGLDEIARKYRQQGNTETIIGRFATRDEADAAADRWRAGNRLPGVAYWTEMD